MTDPILVGLALRDDDAAPLALADELAQFTGAPLALANVVPYEPFTRVPSPELDAALRASALQGLERAAAARPAGVVATVHAVPSGSPVRGLHDLALALDASVLVVGSSHRGALLRVMPGGVGERLLHAAPCAVAVAPRGYAGAAGGVRRIGVAFVDTPEGRDALSAGVMLTALGDAELCVYTALEPPHIGPGAATPGWVPPAPYDARSRIREAEAQMRAQLPEGMEARVTVQEGDPAPLLAEASRRVDVLLCGSRGYGPLRTVLLGGVSGRLAHTAACPLVVLPRATDRALASRARQAAR